MTYHLTQVDVLKKNKNKENAVMTPHLVFLATTKKDKGYQLQEAASTAAEENGIDERFVTVLPLTCIVDAFPSAVEDSGTENGNADQKLQILNQILTFIQKDPQALEKIQKVWEEIHPGHPFEVNNVYVSAEDGGLKIRNKKVWHATRPKCLKVLPQEIIDRADNYGLEEGYGAEIGPISNAMGATPLTAALIESALKCDIQTVEQVPLISRCVFKLKRVLDTLEAPPIKCEAVTPQIVAPRFLENPDLIKLPAPGHLDTTDNYWSLPGRTETLAEMHEEYIRVKSPRAKAMRQFVKQALEQNEAQPESLPVQRTPSTSSAPERHEPVVVKINTQSIREQMKRAKAETTGSRLAQDLDLEPMIGNADAIVFDSMDGATWLEGLYGYHIFFSALVDKVVNPAANRLLIGIGNPHWRQAMHLAPYLANSGMAGDSPLYPCYRNQYPPIKSKNVDIVSSHMFHAVYGHRKKDTEKAVGEILNFALPRLMPHHSIGNLSQEEESFGRLPMGLPFMVAHFTSASTFIKQCLEFDARMGREIAQMGAGHVSGGGDKHGMGATIQNYHLSDGNVSYCSSTRKIIYMENDSGRLAHSTRGEIVNTIYERMGRMGTIADHFLNSFAGFGTVQEAIGMMLGKQMLPDLMGHKLQQFVSFPLPGREGPAYDPVFDMILPKEESEALKHDPMALLNSRGLFVSRNEKEAIEGLHMARDLHAERKRRLKTACYSFQAA